jgi:hypothetical protein
MSDSAPPKNTAPNDTRPEPVECPHCGNVTLPNLLDDSSYVCSCSAEKALPMDRLGGEMPPPVDDTSFVAASHQAPDHLPEDKGQFGRDVQTDYFKPLRAPPGVRDT